MIRNLILFVIGFVLLACSKSEEDVVRTTDFEMTIGGKLYKYDNIVTQFRYGISNGMTLSGVGLFNGFELYSESRFSSGTYNETSEGLSGFVFKVDTLGSGSTVVHVKKMTLILDDFDQGRNDVGGGHVSGKTDGSLVMHGEVYIELGDSLGSIDTVEVNITKCIFDNASTDYHGD